MRNNAEEIIRGTSKESAFAKNIIKNSLNTLFCQQILQKLNIYTNNKKGLKTTVFKCFNTQDYNCKRKYHEIKE